MAVVGNTVDSMLLSLRCFLKGTESWQKKLYGVPDINDPAGWEEQSAGELFGLPEEEWVELYGTISAQMALDDWTDKEAAKRYAAYCEQRDKEEDEAEAREAAKKGV